MCAYRIYRLMVIEALIHGIRDQDVKVRNELMPFVKDMVYTTLFQALFYS